MQERPADFGIEVQHHVPGGGREAAEQGRRQRVQDQPVMRFEPGGQGTQESKVSNGDVRGPWPANCQREPDQGVHYQYE